MGNLCFLVLLDVASASKDLNGCWQGIWAHVRQSCCGPPLQLSCFNAEFDERRCCSKDVDLRPKRHTSSTCLPLKSDDRMLLLHFSTGIDAPRLSAVAQSTECWRHGGQVLYIVMRMRSVEMLTPVFTQAGEAVDSSPETLAARDPLRGKPIVLKQRLRSFLLCVPGACRSATSSVRTLAIFVAEQTLPVNLRPARLISPALVFVEPLSNISQRLGSGSFSSGGYGSRGLRGVPCRSGACSFFCSNGHQNKSVLPVDAVIAVDVGANVHSELLDWLEADLSNRRWALAFEPDPEDARKHPTHPRLAIFESAVGIPEAHGWAVLHRGKSSQCNSLLPLPSDAVINDIAESAGLRGLADCLSSAEAGPVQVRVLSLNAILRHIPSRHEITFLKIDAQGSDLDVVTSAGEELQRVRRLQLEAVDLMRGHPHMPYGPRQPSKENIVHELSRRGFLLDSCRANVHELHEENCLFIRADLLEAPPDDYVFGGIRWDRP